MLGGLALTDAGGAFFATKAVGDCLHWLPVEGHNINEAEAFAASIWVHTFGPCLHGCDVHLFIDNKAAEGSLIKGYSSSNTLAAVAGSFWTAAANSSLRMWIGRVPSRLNPSDGFSRGDFSLAELHGWQQVRPVIPDHSAWSFLLHPTRALASCHPQGRRRLAQQGM